MLDICNITECSNLPSSICQVLKSNKKVKVKTEQNIYIFASLLLVWLSSFLRYVDSTFLRDILWKRFTWFQRFLFIKQGYTFCNLKYSQFIVTIRLRKVSPWKVPFETTIKFELCKYFWAQLKLKKSLFYTSHWSLKCLRKQMVI